MNSFDLFVVGVALVAAGFAVWVLLDLDGWSRPWD
jgi:hypothetical protein